MWPVSNELPMFRIPMVVFTETPGVDMSDAARRAEGLIRGAFQMSGTIVTDPRGVVIRDARRTTSLTVVGIQELNEALRNHEFDVRVRGAGPTFRGRG